MALSRRSFITAVGAGSVGAWTAPLIQARAASRPRAAWPQSSKVSMSAPIAGWRLSRG
jgi:hypothetical protein